MGSPNQVREVEMPATVVAEYLREKNFAEPETVRQETTRQLFEAFRASREAAHQSAH